MSPERPVLRVVSGSPTPEELAVLAAVVTAAAAAAGAAAPAADRVRRGGWNDPAALHCRAPLPGPNGWRASAR